MDQANGIEDNAATGPAANSDGKVINLAYYRIKRSLQSEGFDLISDDEGNLTLVMRVQGR